MMIEEEEEEEEEEDAPTVDDVAESDVNAAVAVANLAKEDAADTADDKIGGDEDAGEDEIPVFSSPPPPSPPL